jgi:MtN3 and saliva related transmembrane protein
MDYLMLGYIAGFLTTFSLLPQIFKVARTKSAKDLSVSWILMATAGYVLWITYGVGLESYPLIIYNAISILLALALLIFKIKYK